jgi:DNA-binding response OmpR family regulator
MVGKQRIGDFFVAQGLLDRDTVEQLGRERLLSQTRLASAAVQAGHITKDQALSALHAYYGYPSVDLDTIEIEREVLQLIPEKVAQEQLVLPIGVEDRNLLLGMVNPMDQQVIEEVSFATGLSVRPHICLHEQLFQAIEAAYTTQDEIYKGPFAPGTDATVQIDAAAMFRAEAEDADSQVSDPESHDDGDTIIVEVADMPETTNDKRACILVVEDDPQIQHLIMKTLEAEGYRVVGASRGLEALKLIKTKKPDLLVLDAMLPEVHGFEICRKVKESRKFGHVPVLMISAMYRGWRIAEDITNTYGVDSFLEKPFRVADLREKVSTLLRQEASPKPHELGKSAKEHFSSAIQAFEQDDFAQAFTLLRQAESEEPFSSRIQFALGQVLEKDAQSFQAMYHYERAMELDPNLYAAAQNLALLYQAKGFKRKAVEMWERALLSAPSEDVRNNIKQHLVNIL